MVTIEQLNAAAQRFYARSDDFAMGKGAICEDLARKLARFGSFASDKQADFAAKLVTWSEPRPHTNAPAVSLPTIFSLVMDKGMSFHLGACKVVLFQSGAVGIVAPVFGQGTYGVIEDGRLKRFAGLTDEMLALLLDVEARGLEAVKEIGRATGRCAICSRMLTNAESIAAGIGPICAERF